ncbi:hypothetical protein RR46_08319 [Papilio xuthus]|uniref:Uncharacterized protein n=1 Tax=Papilio xuthus TaxID=66420 RepID=A0A194PFT6_PAPXU|nr:hypothetical protein RR46_08319 [Papilio xuthus]
MDKDTGKMPKFDPNTEAFQMRAQWKKAEACSKQWAELWSWLLDEQRPIWFLWHTISRYNGQMSPRLQLTDKTCNLRIRCHPVVSRALKESKAIREEAAAELPRAIGKAETKKSLKPVPVTSTGFIGWIASKPDCQLEIYTPWLTHIPLRLPDAWECKNYEAYKS